MTDVIVLTKNAAKITVSEKEGSRSVLANQGRFLAEVSKRARDHQRCSGVAVSDLSLQPVHSTLPGTEPALSQDLPKALNPGAQFAFSSKVNVGRDEGHFSRLPRKRKRIYYKRLGDFMEPFGRLVYRKDPIRWS
jgi:hypothetical protein